MPRCFLPLRLIKVFDVCCIRRSVGVETMMPLSAFHVRFVRVMTSFGTMWPSNIQCSVTKQRVKVVMCSFAPFAVSPKVREGIGTALRVIGSMWVMIL